MPDLSIPQETKTIIIGVTGHRDLLNDDWNVFFEGSSVVVDETSRLYSSVLAKLSELNETHKDRGLLLLTGMAEGADLLVIYVAQKLNIPFIAVLAYSEDVYAKNFSHEPQRALFNHLLPCAQEIVTCAPAEQADSYRQVGITIASYADELIALWNGVDTGLPGGTWEVVRMARTGRDDRGQALPMFRSGKESLFRLHHLLTPRQHNPYPILRLFNFTSLQALLPLGTDYSWTVLAEKRPDKPTAFSLKRYRVLYARYRSEINTYAIPFILFFFTVLFGTLGILNYQDYNNQHRNEPHAHYITKDFHELSGLDAFYKALHLETLITPAFDYEASHVSTLYWIGKYLGMVFFLYAGFGVARKLLGKRGSRLVVLLGHNRRLLKKNGSILLMLIAGTTFLYISGLVPPVSDWIFISLLSIIGLYTYVLIRWEVYSKKTYNLLLGLNDRSTHTLSDLRNKHERVVVLEADNHNAPHQEAHQAHGHGHGAAHEPESHSRYVKSAQQTGATLLSDNPEDPENLRSIGFQQAKEIYLLGTNDRANLHITQQMDWLLAKTGKLSKHQNWYVHIQDSAKRQFLNQFTNDRKHRHLYTFNLYENIARRLLIQYPIDRFYHNPDTPSSDVFVFGYGPLGRQIVITCLKMGHFIKGKRLTLHIYTDNHQEDEEAFFRQYPFFDDKKPFDSGLNNQLATEAFGHCSVKFHSLPESDFELLSDEFQLAQAMKPERILSVYFTFQDEFRSSAYLGKLLGRLHSLHTEQCKPHKADLPLQPILRPADIQLFYYYNFPNEDESALVEHRFNKLAPHIPVVCFGNFIHECSAGTLRDRALDQMAQYIALYYDEVILVKDRSLLSPTATGYPSADDINRMGEWDRIEHTAQDIKTRATNAWIGRQEIDKESNRLFADHVYAKMRLVQALMTLSNQRQLHNTDDTLAVAEVLAQMVRQAPGSDYSLAELEHRRWCAEKLLDGWVPLETDATKIAESASKWNDKADDSFKRLARSQKRHLDLAPMAVLNTIEQNKDLRLIEGIPLFVKLLRIN